MMLLQMSATVNTATNGQNGATAATAAGNSRLSVSPPSGKEHNLQRARQEPGGVDGHERAREGFGHERGHERGQKRGRRGEHHRQRDVGSAEVGDEVARRPSGNTDEDETDRDGRDDGEYSTDIRPRTA